MTEETIELIASTIAHGFIAVVILVVVLIGVPAVGAMAGKATSEQPYYKRFLHGIWPTIKHTFYCCALAALFILVAWSIETTDW